LQLPWNDQHDTFETRWLARPPATPLESIITNTFLNAHAHLFLTSEEQEAQQVEEQAEQERYKREYMSRLRNNKRGGNQTQVDPKPVRLKLVWQDEASSDPSPSMRPKAIGHHPPPTTLHLFLLLLSSSSSSCSSLFSSFHFYFYFCPTPSSPHSHYHPHHHFNHRGRGLFGSAIHTRAARSISGAQSFGAAGRAVVQCIE
jgi:hypothetical protein